jgi:hypothetical protein
MGINLGKVEKDFKENSGFWFQYPEDKEVWIKIKPLYPEKANELARKSIRINPKGFKEVDNEKLSELTRNYVIEDWKGILVDNNAECNNDAKAKLALYCDSVLKFIIAKSSELADTISNQNEEALKNLKTVL